jgi:hypothetical protein
MEKADLSFLSTAVLVNCYEICFCISTAVNHECTKFRGLTVAEFAFVRNLMNLLFSAFMLVYKQMSPLNGYTPDLFGTLINRLIWGNVCYLLVTAVYK